ILMKATCCLCVLILSINKHANSQTQLEGKVHNADGEPLPATSIMLLSNRTVIAVSESGEFKLSLVAKSDTLVISHIGYITQWVPVAPNTRSPLYIQLALDDNVLQEVEVNTGYYTVPKERATGSFTHIDNALLNRSV